MFRGRKPSSSLVETGTATGGRPKEMMWFRYVVAVVALATSVGSAFGVMAESVERPRIGLALSGGGALGAAHAGVIRVLEEIGVPIDYVAGTSMGAIIGGFYAAGMNADQIETVLRNADWNDLFSDKPPREERDMRRKLDDRGFLVRYKFGFKEGRLQLPRGAIQGQKLDLFLRSYALNLVATDNFDELPIPFRAVAADIETGEPVILGSGDFVSALRASMAVSGFFPPVEIEGRLLVDGGLANNLPIDVVRAMGADIVIAVDLPTVLKSEDELSSLVDVLGQSVSILIMRSTEEQLGTLRPDDLLIAPNLGDMSAADFERAVTAIEPGESAAWEVAARLRELAKSRGGHAAAQSSSPSAPISEPIRVDFVRVVNTSRLADDVITTRISLKPGDVLDVKALEEDIADVYGLDYFETVSYRVVTEGGRKGVVITAREKSAGLQSFRFGLNLENHFDGDSQYNIGVRYQNEGITPYGGELIVQGNVGDDLGGLVSFVQPLDPDARYLVIPAVTYLERDVAIFENGSQLAEVRTGTLTGSVRFARQFGEWGAASVGMKSGIGVNDVNIGDPMLVDDDFKIGETFADFRYDKLDDVNFPRQGAVGVARFTQSLEEFNADSDFNQLEIAGSQAYSWNRNTGIIGLDTGFTIDGEAPTQNLFQLGGFLRLSGLQTNELGGQNFLLGQMIYYRNILGSDVALFDVPVYVGGSLEAGNIYDSNDDIELDDVIAAGSMFIGADTFVGPVYFGAGAAERGNYSAFLFLGRTFGRQ